MVAVATGSLAQGLLFRQATLLRAVRAACALPIREIRPLVAPLPPRPLAPVRRRERSVEPLREEEILSVLRAHGGRIGEDDLERSFARMVAAYRRRFGSGGGEEPRP